MNTKKFNDIFWFAPKSKIKAGDGLDQGRFPFYTSSPILSKYINTEQHFDEALIFGTGGRPSVHYSKPEFSTSTDCIVAIATDKSFNTKFVFYYLFGNIHILERGFKGAGLKHISKKYIQNIDIPIFDLEIQNKIVAILDKASALEQKRQRTIDWLDEILRVQFIEMFGEAPINQNGWEYKELGDLLEFLTSGSRGWAKYYANEGDIFLRINNLGYNELLTNDLIFVNAPESAEARRTEVRSGDVLLSITADLGRTAVIPENLSKAFVNQHIAILRPNEIVNPYFLSGYISSKGGRHLIVKYAKGAAKSGLNFNDIKSLKIFIPTKELQEKYESIYKKNKALKSTLISNLEVVNSFYHSILQRAFSGKLNFDVSVELDALLEEIDLSIPENDLISIVTNEEYLLSLVKRLNNQEFENQEIYDKAKHVAFQVLKGEGQLVQKYDKKNKRLILVVK
ncbi:hypothetical protein A9Q87_04615 [Flavobacteriales bacterium 34_180_T64]|nr:hypothetical protein A9Q87_04615 [Flavobacteriales bacterium 34_180_T64]